MKKTSRVALAFACLVTAGQAAPFLAVGDSAELFLTGGIAMRIDDNVFLDQTDENDVIFDVTPGLDLTFGKGGQMQGSLAAAIAFATYADNSDLNTALFSSNFVSGFDDGKMKLNFNLGYAELNQNAPDVRGLTRRDVLSIGGDAEIEITQKTSVGAGVAFNHENYKRSNFTDSDSFTVPLTFYYEMTPKVDLSLGYRFRDYEVDLGADSADHVFTVGGRGEFSPKFTGRFGIGFGTRDLSPGGSENLLALDSSFAYEITPKTSLQFGINNDFGTTPQGQQQKNFSINTAVMMKLTTEWTASGGLSYRAINYGSRTDDYWELNLGGAYIVSANTRILGAYVFRKYVSNISSTEFTNNVFSIAGNFRY